MLPHELDVAFALGSDVAGELLAEELHTYNYAGVLHSLRFLIDAHPESFWNESFYNGWLHAIRSLDDPSEQAELLRTHVRRGRAGAGAGRSHRPARPPRTESSRVFRAHGRGDGAARDHRQLDDDEWQFLRATIEAEKVGCSSEYRYDGWYGQLLYEAEDHGDFRPTIADVHTAPTDASGAPVGWVLHAATGHARYVVFTVEDCPLLGGHERRRAQ